MQITLKMPGLVSQLKHVDHLKLWENDGIKGQKTSARGLSGAVRLGCVRAHVPDTQPACICCIQSAGLTWW